MLFSIFIVEYLDILVIRKWWYRVFWVGFVSLIAIHVFMDNSTRIMSKPSRRVFFLLSIVVVYVLIFSSILASVATKIVFGDGLSQEQPSASVGNRKSDLPIKRNPSLVTTETLQKGQKPIVQLRLFD